MSQNPVEGIGWVRRNLTRLRSLKIEEQGDVAVITSKNKKHNQFFLIVSFIPTKERGEVWKLSIRHKTENTYYSEGKSSITMILRRCDRVKIVGAIAKAYLTEGG